MQDDKTYVFLSHSHHDFEKVCRLRNLLESEGFKPLMFFLKAFDKPEYEPMLKPILKEEIDQRQRFILCRSENSKKSNWVKFEEDYIKSKNRPYEVVDLDASEDFQIESIKNYRCRSRVFISYPKTLKSIVRHLIHMLQENGFTTFVDFTDIKSGREYALCIIDAIKKAADEGYVLFLIDSDTMGDWQMNALLIAQKYKSRVIPVYVQGEEFSPELEFYIGRMQILDVRNLPHEEQIRRIVEHLINYDLQFNVE